MGKSLRETAGSYARLRRCNECHFGVADRRKAIRRVQHSGVIWTLSGLRPVAMS